MRFYQSLNACRVTQFDDVKQLVPTIYEDLMFISYAKSNTPRHNCGLIAQQIGQNPLCGGDESIAVGALVVVGGIHARANEGHFQVSATAQ